MDHSLQILLRKKVLAKIGSIWELPLTNDWENVLDEGISKGCVNWQIYGSQKPGYEAYRLTYHTMASIDLTDNEFMTIPQNIKEFDLSKNLFQLSAQYRNHPKFEIHPKIMEEYNKLLSSVTKKSKPRIKPNLVLEDDDDNDEEICLSDITDANILNKAITNLFKSLKPSEYYITEIHEYTQILPEKFYRPGSHLLNRQVAFALKHTDDRLFLSWVMFRSKAVDFNYDSIPSLFSEWKKFSNGRQDGITKRSIMYWARQDAFDDYEKVKNLLQSGMNIARINCAHDDESVWLRMIQHVKRASTATGLNCKIYMDLAGPKIRTVFHKQDKLNIEVGKHIYLTDQKHLNTDKATVGCTLIGIVEQLNPGESVLFDDGLIEARVEEIEDHRAKLQILRISKKKPVIKAEKGINFPDSILTTPALTEYDKKCLSFIEEHADMVGYSFVRSNKDIIQLHEALGENQKLDLVIKIETPEAVKNLPDLLFCGMRRENVGVMIARGDLAVEIGFERMSEIQEEILWICEAAHVPVIWATQVLENLNKSGMATRSEVTDAAHAALADCVMINKGNYIIQTMETLRDILLRSGGHHVKKRYTFRPLSIAMRFMTR
jgi:pyruvate kinase